MRENLSRSSSIGNLDVHTRELIFECKVTGNAVDASKTFTVDAKDVILMRFKGLTATADALEAVTWTTAVDATNALFGILIDGAKLTGSTSNIRKVKKATVSQIVATGSAITVTPPNASSTATAMLTAGGNIGIEVTMTGTDLSSGSVAPTFCVHVIYEVFQS